MSSLADRAALLSLLRRVAEAAGRVILEVYATDFAVRDKGVNDPVTIADERANALIVEALAAAYPGVPIVAEESDRARYAGFEREPAAFFVDPLDGTREFVAKNGEFVVMIGLAEAGRAVAGVIHAPARGVTWCGAVGHGATVTDSDGEWAIAASHAPPETARAVVSRSRRGERLNAVLARAGVREVTQLGSAGLKGAAAASGEADLYAQLGNAGSLWDSCGPEAIVLAAGGAYTDQYGKPIDYRGEVVLTRGIVAGSPLACAAFVKAAGEQSTLVVGVGFDFGVGVGHWPSRYATRGARLCSTSVRATAVREGTVLRGSRRRRGLRPRRVRGSGWRRRGGISARARLRRSRSFSTALPRCLPARRSKVRFRCGPSPATSVGEGPGRSRPAPRPTPTPTPTPRPTTGADADADADARHGQGGHERCASASIGPCECATASTTWTSTSTAWTRVAKRVVP